jgi:excisionase family DNA binding protein
MSEVYYSTDEAAEYVKRTAPAVRKLAQRRRIPFRKASGRLMFLKSELDQWIQDAPGVKPEDIDR